MKMRRLLFTAFLLLGVGIPSFAQYYYANRGDEFSEINWKRRAFMEYETGMNAGESASALRVSICYANEEGTPRNVEKARSILDKWSQKDPAICLFCSVLYSPKVATGWWFGEFEEKISGTEFSRGYPKVYGIRLGGGGYNGLCSRLGEDYDKAIFYAQRLDKQLQSKASQQYLLALNKAAYPEKYDNKIQNLRIFDNPGGYDQDLTEAVEYCKTLDDLSQVIEIDRSKPYTINGRHYFDYWADQFYFGDKFPQAVSQKCLDLYKAYLKGNGDDPELTKQKLSADSEKQKAVEVALPLAVKVLVSAHPDQIEWVSRNIHFEDVLESSKVIWTRRQIRDLVKAYSMEWPKYEEVFTSPFYVSLDGGKEITERYLSILQSTESEYDRAMSQMRYKDDHLDYVAWGKISTQKEDYALIKKCWEDRELNKMLELEEKACSWLDYYAEHKDVRKDSTKLKLVRKELMRQVQRLADFRDVPSYERDSIRKQQHLLFTNLLLDETNGSANYRSYYYCQTDIPAYKSYVAYKIKTLKTKRQMSEESILGREGYSRQEIKDHDAFRKYAAKGVRKSLTPQLINAVSPLVEASLEQGRIAFIKCPDPAESPSVNVFAEEQDVLRIIRQYQQGTSITGLATEFLKTYPQSSYTQLITDYYNDSYALLKAGELTKDSTDEEIQTIKSLPVTKEVAKQIKTLTDRKFLRTKL